MFWDFITLRPETSHQVTLLFADRGIPDGFRHMHGNFELFVRFIKSLLSFKIEYSIFLKGVFLVTLFSLLIFIFLLVFEGSN
jgi:hypothetical protein